MLHCCFHQTKNQKKAREAAILQADESYSTVPHTFVFHRGQIGKNVGQLVLDMRRVMEPYTARSLKVRLAIPAAQLCAHLKSREYTLTPLTCVTGAEEKRLERFRCCGRTIRSHAFLNIYQNRKWCKHGEYICIMTPKFTLFVF